MYYLWSLKGRFARDIKDSVSLFSPKKLKQSVLHSNFYFSFI